MRAISSSTASSARSPTRRCLNDASRTRSAPLKRALYRPHIDGRGGDDHRGGGPLAAAEDAVMRKFALVVSDVDGTLVTTDKRLTAAAIAAAARLHAAGIAFSICSSRPPFGQRMLIAPLGLKLPFGGYNGGAIVNPDLSPVEQKLLTPAAAEDAIALLEKHGITSIWVFTGREWLIRDPAGDYVDLEIHTIDTPPSVVASFAGRQKRRQRWAGCRSCGFRDRHNRRPDRGSAIRAR